MGGAAGKGHGAGDVMPAPTLPVPCMPEGCEAGKSLPHGKHSLLGRQMGGWPLQGPGKQRTVLQTRCVATPHCKTAGAGHGAMGWGAHAALGPLPHEQELCPGSWPHGHGQPEPVLWPQWEPAAAPSPGAPAAGQEFLPCGFLGCEKGTNEMNEWGSTDGRLCPGAKVLCAGRTGWGSGIVV